MQDMDRLSQSESRVVDTEGEIDLLAIARTVWNRRALVLAVAGVGLVGSAVIALSQPNIYTSTASLMPVDSSNDRLSMALSSLGALGGLASQTGLGKGSISDKFLALLQSRTIAESVIQKHSLIPTLFPERWDPNAATWKTSPTSWLTGSNQPKPPTMYDAVRRIKKMVVSQADRKTGVIEISVEHPDPQAAADIANYYVVELNSVLRGNSFTSAKQNKDFLEKQLQVVETELKAAESNLKRFQEDHKLVSLDAQTEASVQAYATLKSQLMAKEMEIGLQEKSTSENDIQLIGLKQEAAQIQEKLAGLENGSSGGMVSFKDAPKLGMQFAQFTRELMVRQKVYELITQQYELAKIEEAKEALTFQVIDRAIPADRKSKPKRLTLMLIATAAFAVLGVVVALTIDKFKRPTAPPLRLE